MNRTFWNSASLCGLLLALITIAVFLISSFFPSLPTGLKALLTLVKTVATIYLLYSYMKEYAEAQDYCSYGTAFRFGFMTSLCSAVMVGAYLFCHFQFLFPDQVESTMATARATLEAQGQLDATLLRTIDRLFPSLMALSQVLWLTLAGTVISAVLANATKSKTPFQTPGIQ